MSKFLLSDEILVFLLGYALLYIIWEVFNKSPLLKVWKRGKKRSKLSLLSYSQVIKEIVLFETDFGVYIWCERESFLKLWNLVLVMVKDYFICWCCYSLERVSWIMKPICDKEGKFLWKRNFSVKLCFAFKFMKSIAYWEAIKSSFLFRHFKFGKMRQK